MLVEVKVIERPREGDEAQVLSGTQWEEEMALVNLRSHSQKSSAMMAQFLSTPTFYPNITGRLTI